MALGTTIKVGLDTAGVKKGLANIKGMFSRFRGFAGRGLRRGLIGGAELVAGLAAATKNAASYATEIKNASDQTGQSVREILQMREALRLAGIQADDTGSIISDMNEKIEDAGKGGSPDTRDALGMIGLRMRDLGNLTSQQRFAKIMESIAGSSLDMGKMAWAMDKIFGGEAGMKMVPLARDFDGYMERAANNTGDLADSLSRNMRDLKGIQDGLGRVTLALRNAQLRFLGAINLEALVKLLNSDFLDKIFYNLNAFLESPGATFEALADYAMDLGKKIGEGVKSMGIEIGQSIWSGIGGNKINQAADAVRGFFGGGSSNDDNGKELPKQTQLLQDIRRAVTTGGPQYA